MGDTTYFQKLHNRFARGQALSQEEQTALNNWYSEQDRAESQALLNSMNNLEREQLESKIQNALSELQVVTHRIQELASENESLRREIAQLKHQLVHMPVSAPV